MELLHQALHFITHLQESIAALTQQYGNLVYGILFLIIFCETGLVLMPFLPGDSLLFIAGALCAPAGGGHLKLGLICVLLPLAAVIGDSLNYWVGRYLGPRVFSRPKSLLFNADVLHRTQAFYDRHGKKTVILARFIPLVRTFAPFVAGVGRMNYPTFLVFGIAGAFFWVVVCAGAGYIFGDFPIVKKHFELIILGVIGVSLLPPVIAWINARKEAKAALESADKEEPGA
jgi:membrane-associated protein